MGRVEGYKSGGGHIKCYHYKGIGRRSSHAEEGGHNIFLGSFTQGGDLVSTMPVCVCPKVKDMGPFSASSE